MAEHDILIAGDLATTEWVAVVQRLLPLALNRLADVGVAPGRTVVSVSLVDDSTIRDLNRRFRRVDSPTDVLSFSQLEGAGPDWRAAPPEFPVALGDIVVSIPRMRAQATEYGHGEARELGYLLVHGLLHLLGYDHQSPDQAQAMRAAEEDLLGTAGLSRQSDS